MNPKIADTTSPETATAKQPPIEVDEPALPTASADPVVAEEVGHPVGVGIGAAGAGAAGAAIGAVAGPVGMLVGAAIGALAGGLIGGEVAAAGEEPVGNADSSYTLPPLSEPRSVSTGSLGGGSIAEPSSGALLAGSDNNVPVSAAPVIPHVTAPASAGEPTSLEADEEETSPVEDAYPEEEIRTSAYYRYLDRSASGLGGDEVEDWIEAERARLRS